MEPSASDGPDRVPGFRAIRGMGLCTHCHWKVVAVSDVKRYDFDDTDGYDHGPRAEGKYILASDYDALSQQMAELEKDAARWRYLERTNFKRYVSGYGDNWTTVEWEREQVDKAIAAEQPHADPGKHQDGEHQ